MPTELTISSYNKLLSDISQIYERARQQSIIVVNKITVGAYWQIGRRIIQEEQRGSLRAEYGEKTLQRLSDDLTKKFNRGFSPRNLRNMRQFYLAYPIWQNSAKLRWSLYQLLSTVKEEDKRQSYEKEAVKYNWTYPQLVKQIRKDKVELIKFSLDHQLRKRQKEPVPKLSLTRGLLYTYKILEPEYVNQTQETVVVDCGFYINTQIPLGGVSRPKQGQIITSTKTEQGEYKFSLSDAKTNQLYTYKALVEEVTDADTLWSNIDVGFNIWLRQKLRFRGIDAPEISTKKGQKAKQFVEAVLSKVNFIVIKSHGVEKYGRRLADVFYLIGESDPQKVLAEGIFLNQQLLDLGLARQI